MTHLHLASKALCDINGLSFFKVASTRDCIHAGWLRHSDYDY